MNQENFIQLIAFALNDVPEKADTIVFIEGDGSSKPEAAVQLYQEGLAPKILVTGETERIENRKKFRTKRIITRLLKLGVPAADIISETNSISSREQAVEILKIAKKNNWRKIILCAPLYHKPRLYATFIKAMNEASIKIKIINHPVRALPWFEPTENGTRLALFKKELGKTQRYFAKGHVASWKEIVNYHKWKEKN